MQLTLTREEVKTDPKCAFIDNAIYAIACSAVTNR